MNFIQMRGALQTAAKSESLDPETGPGRLMDEAADLMTLAEVLRIELGNAIDSLEQAGQNYTADNLRKMLATIEEVM